MLKRLFLIGFIVLITACAHSQREPLHMNTLTTLPDVAVEFETTVVSAEKEQRYRWKFWRNENRIETRNLNDNSGEIWTKSIDGKIEYERIFHDQKQVIDYRDSDLMAIGETPNWFAMATLLNPIMTATLLSDNEESAFGQTAVHYKNNDVEITWLTESQIPAMIQRDEKGHSLTTKIVSMKIDAPLKTTDYRHIDFADIGDKESDPFIQSILSKLKGSHHHEH